jgi:hypothetical protein
MASDLERLIVTLEASTKQYTNEIKKVRSDTNKMFQAMQGEITANSRRVESAFGQMGGRAAAAFKESFMGIARGAAASLLGGFALEKLADSVRESVRAIADLGDEAADLGVSTESLQVFSRMAIEAGTDAEQMGKALGLVAAQSQDANSKLSKLFASMGRTVTGDVTTDMLTLMNVLERMQSPTERLATIMDIFGPKLGRSLAETLTSGSQAYFQTLHEMQQAGDIYTTQQEKDARRIDAAWNTMVDHLGTRWHGFLLDAVVGWDKFVTEFETGLARMNRGDFSGSALSQIYKKFFGEAAPAAPPAKLPAGVSSGTSSDVEALAAAAAELGVTAKDLATAIAYETGGTFSPSTPGKGAAAGRFGLIQFGPNEAAEFGAAIDQSFSEQMKAVVAYLKARGLQPGSSLLDLYSTINAGAPGRYGASDVPGKTVASHVAEMGPFASMAEQWLTGVIQRAMTSGVPPGHVGTPGYEQSRLGVPGVKPGDAFDLSDIKTVDDATKGWQDYNDAINAVERSTGQMTASQALMIAGMKDVIKGVKEVNDALASSVENFATQLLDGASASDALKSALRQLAQQMLHMAIQGLFNFGGASGGLLGAIAGLPKAAPGFATGGSFQVGGAGGTDSRMVSFRATPGEFVDISRPGMRGRGGGQSISMGGIAINVEGSADERTLAIMERRLQQAQAKQMSDLQRNWGVMTSRYQSHRGP